MWAWATYVTVVAAGTPGWVLAGDGPNPWFWGLAFLVAGLALVIEVASRVSEFRRQLRALRSKRPSRKRFLGVR